MKNILPFFLFAALSLIPQLALGAEFAFECPEHMSAHERQEQNRGLWGYCRKEHPDWTIRDLMEYRKKLLIEHGCTLTLEDTGKGVRAGEGNRYICTAKNGQQYFSSRPWGGCRQIKIEEGWANFCLIPSVLVDFKSGSLVSEADGKTIRLRFYLADVYPDVSGRWSYDYVESVHKFYCGKQKTRLVEGTYKLGGKTVHVQPESESVIDSVDPGTINETLYDLLCNDR